MKSSHIRIIRLLFTIPPKRVAEIAGVNVHSVNNIWRSYGSEYVKDHIESDLLDQIRSMFAHEWTYAQVAKKLKIRSPVLRLILHIHGIDRKSKDKVIDYRCPHCYGRSTVPLTTNPTCPICEKPNVDDASHARRN